MNKSAKRDEFFWLGQINKASVVINADIGLLDGKTAVHIASALQTVLQNGEVEGGKRPGTVITFEPLLIEAGGQEVTLLHAGRSSQDMHGAYYAAIMRDNVLEMAAALGSVLGLLTGLAERYEKTVVPNYTNGVAAQPNSYGHYLLGFVAGFRRDFVRLRQAYERLDRCPMGTTVLNGSCWPLERERMAAYLGFGAVADNAYDAVQISSMEYPADVGAVVTAIALHVGAFIEDIMTQYAQPWPWILLQEGEGTTYVSSAMPQKRNPGLLNNTRRDASTAISLAMGAVLRAHNIPPGMVDAKSAADNAAMTGKTVAVLKGFAKILSSLVVDPERALEELNSDWTASQELADRLMREYGMPFRVGHHFASQVVSFAKQEGLTPLTFPYAEAQRIFAAMAAEHPNLPALPMSEAEFAAALDPVSIVESRATPGGPQHAEMARMLADAKTAAAENAAWTEDRKNHIAQSLAALNRDFTALLRG
ncbi:MAG: Argininosuccinate lyase [Desulfovibrio sp.]